MDSPTRLLVCLSMLVLLGACAPTAPGAASVDDDANTVAAHHAGAATPSNPESPHAAAKARNSPQPSRPSAGDAYACDGGQHVDVAQDVAVVRLADGRAIEIRRDPAVPSRFRNEALEFSVGPDGAQLAQDEGGIARCRAG